MPPLAAPFRAALALIALILALLLLAAPASAESVPARPAQAFVNSLGINTHTYYQDTVYYQRFETIERRLHELGVRHIRENVVLHRPDQYRMLNRLADHGIDAQLIAGDPRNGLGGMRALVDLLANRLDDAVAAIEGPNEYDLSGDRRWRPKLARYQRALYRQVRATPELAGIPVVGPSIGPHHDPVDVPDLTGALDFGNVHSYPDGDAPEPDLDEWLGAASRTSGPKRVMATETGYHTALRARDGQRPVSEAAMATYVPRVYLDYFARGIVRTFPYELADERPDPRRVEPEENFGLLRHDLSPKPAFTAVRNLVDLVEDPGPRFTAGSLDFTLGGDTEELGSLLLQKRDGRFYLALWRTTSVWDADARARLSPGASPVRLTFATQPDRVTLFLPNRSGTAQAELPLSAGATSLEVGPRVAVLEIDPAG